MDDLPYHLLLPSVTKVTNSGIKNLFRFRTTSLRYRRFLSSPVVLRALPRSYLFYLFDPKPCTEKIAFMQQLSDNGHSIFCIALPSQLFQQPDTDVEEVKRVLRAVARHVSDGAKYFLMILDVLAEGGFSVGGVFSVFIDLFVHKQVARCKRSLMNLRGPFWADFSSSRLSVPPHLWIWQDLWRYENEIEARLATSWGWRGIQNARYLSFLSSRPWNHLVPRSLPFHGELKVLILTKVMTTPFGVFRHFLLWPIRWL